MTTSFFLPVLNSGFANAHRIYPSPSKLSILKTKGTATIAVRWFAGINSTDGYVRKRYEVYSEGVLCWYGTCLKSMLADFNMAAKLVS